MPTTIFYSWQSELPNKTNRGLIEEALEGAAKAIREDSTIEASPRVDKDTAGVPGAPDIGAAIFGKIDEATVFVCDVSLLNRGSEARPTPNPNVLVELGYALARLTWGRIIMVVNEAFGAVEDLPFDLNKKRALVYRSAPDDAERAPARTELRRKLEHALRDILEHHEQQVAPAAPPSPAARAISAIEQEARDAPARTAEYMRTLAVALDTIKSPPGKGHEDDVPLVAALDASLPIVTEYAHVVAVIAEHGDTKCVLSVARGFGPLLEACEKVGGGTWFETDFDFYRFIAHELFVMMVAALMQADQWALIAEALEEEFPTKTNHGTFNAPFFELSRHAKLFDMRGERLHSRTDLRAELLKTRHSTGDLGQRSPFEAFLDADFFLFLRGELPPEKSPITENGDGHVWRPWSGVHMSWRVPAFLMRAQKVKFATQLLAPLALSDLETFRDRYAARAGSLRRLFYSRADVREGTFDATTIGTQ